MLQVIKRTPKSAEEIKAETLTELTELGFVNLPKATSDETWDAIWEQIDTDSDLWDKAMDATVDYYETDLIDEHNFEKYLEWWLENQVERLFPND